MNPLRSSVRRLPSIAHQAHASPGRFTAALPTGRGMATKREDHFRDKTSIGGSTWISAALFLATGTGLYFYFESEKQKVQERRREELATKSIGRPSIGGPFTLLNTDSQPFTEENLLGKWTLIYFGFTHCPDICPEELDKMGQAVDLCDKFVGSQGAGKEEVMPLFVSVDPARDSIEQVKKYITDFHPKLVGLTGDYESIKRACKSYRVYFSTPPTAKPGDDYLVDHSIFFYLMDPLGQFVDAFGKNTTAQEVAEKVRVAMGKWEKAGGTVGAAAALAAGRPVL